VGSALWPRYLSVSTVIVMHAVPSMPIDIPTATQEKEPVVVIILVAVDATIAARTRA